MSEIPTENEIQLTIENGFIKEKYIKDDAFLSRMDSNYMKYINGFKDLIRSRSSYEESPDSFKDEQNVLKIYDLSTKTTDIEIKIRIEYTAIWELCKHQIDYPRSFTKENEKGVPVLQIEEIMGYLEEKYCPVVFHGIFYLYIDNQYYEDRFNKIKKDIVRILKECGYSDDKKISSILDEIINRSKASWQKHGEKTIFNQIKGLIPVKNGVITLNGSVFLYPNSPAWGYTYCLPVIYDEKADTAFINQFIIDICMEDGIRIPEKEELLVQIPAQALMQDTANPAYLLNGGGSNAKSTYLQFIGDFVGGANYSSITLQALSHERFKASELYGKLFNICADIPKDLVKDTGTFKMVTGGDMITAEKKFGQPFRFINRAVLIFSANELPMVDDNTYAFWRRWNIIDFMNKFKEDEDFKKKLLTENNKSAFLNMVIEEIRVIKNNRLIINKKSDEIMEQWKMKSNSAYAYLKPNIKKSANEHIGKKILYNEYYKFCGENDVTAQSPQKFNDEVEKLFKVVEASPIVSGERLRSFKGISFKNENDKEIDRKEQELKEIKKKETRQAVIAK
jgi:P4 family phage/plasmid primase-like protien